MVRNTCSVPLCKNWSEKAPLGTSWHVFPKDTAIRKAWVTKIRRDKDVLFRISKHSKVCSAHFLETDYCTRANPLNQCKVRKLKTTAIPSVFSWVRKEKIDAALCRAKRYNARSHVNYIMKARNIVEEKADVNNQCPASPIAELETIEIDTNEAAYVQPAAIIADLQETNAKLARENAILKEDLERVNIKHNILRQDYERLKGEYQALQISSKKKIYQKRNKIA